MGGLPKYTSESSVLEAFKRFNVPLARDVHMRMMQQYRHHKGAKQLYSGFEVQTFVAKDPAGQTTKGSFGSAKSMQLVREDRTT